MAVKTRRFIIEIKESWCKGCEICVAFCPKDVLTMEGAKAKVANLDACTGCQLCEIYCPDFAIKVLKKEDNDE
ncbi:MAG TPA: 4Fe-4S dicluster domain-containing protein [candidate division WOR-3 bacterium]|uniref:4Fe-4S dicluster domain-containing protein n=1 Tax=candidate division WOR-3 bacterium TaxID=2052148 RepID=A0A9C9JZE4_UNCW3|nr:4Fe-4S dicluster domain-containing protein [candidate division WOR-3 bacterium]